MSYTFEHFKHKVVRNFLDVFFFLLSSYKCYIVFHPEFNQLVRFTKKTFMKVMTESFSSELKTLIFSLIVF